jgi:hypothetical protein
LFKFHAARGKKLNHGLIRGFTQSVMRNNCKRAQLKTPHHGSASNFGRSYSNFLHRFRAPGAEQ